MSGLVCPGCGWSGFDGVHCNRCGYGYKEEKELLGWCGTCGKYSMKHKH